MTRVGVAVIQLTSKHSSLGMGKDIYRSLKFKHQFPELSNAKQQKHWFVTDLSYVYFYCKTLTLGDFLRTLSFVYISTGNSLCEISEFWYVLTYEKED